jgi:hypothetical protein
MRTRVALRCALTVATLGCNGFFGPGDGPPIRTDQPAYRLEDTGIGLETQIPFTFRNRTGGPVYIPNCGGNAPPMLQKLEDGQWVNAWAPVVLLCLSPPIVITPGTTYADTLRVFGGHPGNNMYPKFDVPHVPGTYRLLWPSVLTSYDDRRNPFGDSLPVDERISNPFALTQ